MNNTLTLPEIGSMVKVLYIPSINEDQMEWAIGQIVPVTRAEIRAGNTRNGWDDSHPVCWATFTKPGEDALTYEWYFTEWEPVADGSTLTVSETVDEIAGIRIPENCTVGEYRALIEIVANDLAEEKRKYTSASEERDRLRTQVGNAHTAIDHIGNAFIDEANRRGWCSEADDFIAKLNSTISTLGYELPVREQEYTIEVTVTGSISTSYTFTVTAQNEDTAREIAESDLRYGNINLDSVLTDAANNHFDSFDDIDWDIESVDAE